MAGGMGGGGGGGGGGGTGGTGGTGGNGAAAAGGANVATGLLGQATGPAGGQGKYCYASETGKYAGLAGGVIGAIAGAYFGGGAGAYPGYSIGSSAGGMIGEQIDPSGCVQPPKSAGAVARKGMGSLNLPNLGAGESDIVGTKTPESQLQAPQTKQDADSFTQLMAMMPPADSARAGGYDDEEERRRQMNIQYPPYSSYG